VTALLLIPWLAGAYVIYPETWEDPWWTRLGLALSWPIWVPAIGVLVLVVLPVWRGVKEITVRQETDSQQGPLQRHPDCRHDCPHPEHGYCRYCKAHQARPVGPPDRIYLQEWDCRHYETTTWCVDKINDEDATYILATPAREAAEEMERALMAIETGHMGDWSCNCPAREIAANALAKAREGRGDDG
jgi:hypothetical protein